MIWTRRAFKLRAVARVALGRRSGELIIDVTKFAVHSNVCARQWKARDTVVKGRTLPLCLQHVVAVIAFL